MVTPPCPDRKAWTDYRNGRLPEEQMERLEQHLESCARCQDLNDAISREEIRDPIGRAGGDARLSEAEGFLGRLIDETIREVERCPHYQRVTFLARGGMGIILKAELIPNVIPVVLKVFHPMYYSYVQGGVPAERGLQRFLREADVALMLQSHPRIIPVREFRRLENVQLIEMNPVLGVTLTEYCKERLGGIAANEDLVFEWATMLAEAVSALDRKGIVHRDIKPDNCLVNPLAARFSLRLLDFGIASVKSDVTITLEGVSMGTARFRAPEQERNAARVDTRADLFSLGMTLAWTLSDRHAWDAIEHGIPAETLNRVSPPMRQLLERLTQPDKAQRYASASSLLADLPKLQAKLHASERKMRTHSFPWKGVLGTLFVGAAAGAGVYLTQAPSGQADQRRVQRKEIEADEPWDLAPRGRVFECNNTEMTVEGEFQILDPAGQLEISLREQPQHAGLILVVPGSHTRRVTLHSTRPGIPELQIRSLPSEDLFLVKRWLPFKARVSKGVADFWIDGRLILSQTKDLPDTPGNVRISGHDARVRKVRLSPGLQ